MMRFKLLNNHNTFSVRLKNEKGQVALFVALVFQILFLFFAMVINVGLLVHHKINLQNSVDLAAYYGAMKQAENMNVIAHVNYQIRQSWKLLAWRYRIVGTAGDFKEHPYRKLGVPGLQNGDPDTDERTYSGTTPDYIDFPAFCATYVPFKPMPKNENTCQNMSSLSTLQLFQVPPVIAGFISITHAVKGAALQALNQAVDQCKIAGTYNYILLGSFVAAFNIDQGDRSLFITQLSRSMSASTDDFWDIDGESVKDGIRKTLENNLTTANKAGLSEFQVFNSLGAESCNSSSRPPTSPPKWLAKIETAPAFAYYDTICDHDKIKPSPKSLPDLAGSKDTANLPNYYMEDSVHHNTQNVLNLSQWIGFRDPPSDPYNYSMGVEKNPWCMAYVGVKAESAPSIPFSLGSIKLLARSFAKPFGGRIGPWYKSAWSPGAAESNGGFRVDPLAPPRRNEAVGNYKDPTRAPNYSRFIGDKYGIKTRNVQYQYGKSIYELDPRWKSTDPNALANVNVADLYNDNSPNFTHWTAHLPFKFHDKQSGNGDLLAWSSQDNTPSRMRELELTAILPDAFDIAYYSIEPDFYHNYYKRIADGFLSKPVGRGFNKFFRPDIGYNRDGGKAYKEFSIKDQYKALRSDPVQYSQINFDQKLTYVTRNWQHLLTSWAPQGLLDFSLNKGYFGKCLYPAGDEKLDVPTSGNCVSGGRTGYSVKLVAADYLRKGDLELGGSGGGQGPLRNPPPDDF